MHKVRVQVMSAMFFFTFVLAALGQPAALPLPAVDIASDHSVNYGSFTKDVKDSAELLRLPGFAIAVVQNGKTIYRLNSGYADIENHIPVTNDTIFSLASVTKSFTAVMMMQYEQEKKISLDDYLLDYPLDTSRYVPSTIDPDTRLKHVLSMTSGDVPGMTFAYNGWRYSFLSAVFDSISNLKSPDSYGHEIQARILGPLKMKDTFDGYPDKPNERTKRVARGYYLEASAAGAIYKAVPYDTANYYPGPAAGLFSTIDDLAVYTTALDDNTLIPSARYNEMTSPYAGVKSEAMPYGFGWMTQTFHGLQLHWAYGEGNIDSALLLRVPERHLSLIML